MKNTIKKRLTKAQKRMLVLKDALKQIKLKILRPAQEGVCKIPTFSWGEEQGNGQAQKLLKSLRRKKKPCTVCARGSLLLATVSRFNDFTLDQLHQSQFDEGSFDSDNQSDKRLIPMFSEYQLALMERAFEGTHNSFILSTDDMALADAIYFHYKRPRARLIAILENAISNKGIFKP